MINDPNLTTINASEYSGMGYTSLIITSPITEIGMNAFSDNDLISVMLPSTLLTIGETAFANNNLMSVILPNSLLRIRPGAFQNNKLSSITIPSSVTILGQGALGPGSFTGNPNLLTVIIPKHINDNANPAITYSLHIVFGPQVTRYEDIDDPTITYTPR